MESLKNKLKPQSDNTAFVHNTTFVILSSTLIFMEMLERNFDIDNADITYSQFSEKNL